MKKSVFTRVASLARIDRIREALLMREMTTEEIAAAVHINTSYAREYIKHLRSRFDIHIVGYRAVKRTHLWHHPIYAWGPGTDAPPPKRQTDAQRARERRRDPEKKLADAMKQRAKRIQPRRDWTASWIPIREAA